MYVLTQHLVYDSVKKKKKKYNPVRASKKEKKKYTHQGLSPQPYRNQF